MKTEQDSDAIIIDTSLLDLDPIPPAPPHQIFDGGTSNRISSKDLRKLAHAETKRKRGNKSPKYRNNSRRRP